ncbi:MAG: DNA mismatch repair endonuclease MutL, partial [Pseudoflavonifractor sp.]
MANIEQLNSHVADLIAAGEVVERPASVVKELMENAIDAGATAMTVEIQNGGMALVRVTDNGCGMDPADAETAFLRHATSKIKNEYDLEAIGTLGFRGEALAAIAAVSRITLLTRIVGAALGTTVSLEGGTVTEHEQAGCPEGTTMLVRDLFYNTPARLKFVKKDAAEGAAVFAVVQRMALAHPEVSVKFLRDGKQELLTPGDGQLKSAIYSVFGRDLALGFAPVRGSGEEMSVAGFASLPTCCRGTRGYQHFFVNGRYVKSRTMMAALEEAYKNQKMVGKFPGCVLHLTTKLNAVDVNVHPTKTEVKFASDKRVFDAVYYAVQSSLEGEHAHPQAVLSRPKPADTVTPNQMNFGKMTAAEYRGGNLPLHDYTHPKPPAPRPTDPAKTPPKAEPPKTAVPAAIRPPEPVSAPPEPLPTAPPTTVAPPPTPVSEEVPWRILGEAMNTYIIVEQG